MVNIIEAEYQPGWLMRIYQPEGPGPFPALMDVHGGAWTGGDRTQNDLANQALAASGVLIFAVDYRLGFQHPYPAQVQDVNLAARWFKAHAGEFKATAEGMGGIGTSSGAHTLLLSAMKPFDSRYNAFPHPGDARLSYVILCWGVLDSWARYQYAKPLRDDNAGRGGAGSANHLAKATEGYFVTEEAMKEGNPQLILERGEKVELPPALVVQGYPDSNIPKAIPERFVESYKKAGGSIEIEWFPGAPHGFMRNPSADTDRALEVIKAFIARQRAGVGVSA